MQQGTYVRTLAADLGAKLGCGAHLAGLRRTRTAGFDIADAIALDALVEMTPEARMARAAARGYPAEPPTHPHL